jgi:hypothetical protein
MHTLYNERLSSCSRRRIVWIKNRTKTFMFIVSKSEYIQGAFDGHFLDVKIVFVQVEYMTDRPSVN